MAGFDGFLDVSAWITSVEAVGIIDWELRLEDSFSVISLGFPAELLRDVSAPGCSMNSDDLSEFLFDASN